MDGRGMWCGVDGGNGIAAKCVLCLICAEEHTQFRMLVTDTKWGTINAVICLKALCMLQTIEWLT